MIHATIRPLVWGFLLLLLGGCSSQLAKEKQQADDEMLAAIEVGSESQPPAVVEALLLPELRMGSSSYAETTLQRRFDVRASGLRARDFFISLVEGTPYDMVIDPDVGGKISLELKSVTVPEVMEIVRTVHGYDYRMRDQVVQVFPNTLQTRMFQIDYLALQRSGSSITNAGSSSASGESSSSGTSSITTQSNDNIWEQLGGSLEMILQGGEGSSFTLNPMTGVIMVRALPTKLREVEEYLQQSQQILTRQVILEARVLEVELNSGFQAGINWAEIQTSAGHDLILAQPGQGAIVSGTQNLQTSTTGAAATVATVAATQLSGLYNIGLSGANFSGFIEMLRSQGEVQVLSSPRIATINNQKAVIKVGADEFFVNGYSTTTDTNGIVTPTFSLGTFFSGVALDVTPQIGRSGDIVLHVHPTISEVSEKQKNVGSVSIPLASSSIRESDTIVRAHDGQLVIIGGLMQTKTKDVEGKIPLLGDIPWLGALFSYTQQVRVKSELVILIRPIIIDAQGSQWQQQIHSSTNNLNRLRNSEGQR